MNRARLRAELVEAGRQSKGSARQVPVVLCGRLEVVEVEGRPVVLRQANGAPSQLLLPRGWRWAGGCLHDDSGMPRARLGEEVTVRGRLSPGRTTAQVGPVVEVHTIEQVGGSAAGDAGIP